MKPRALRLAQKLEWFSGKEIQEVDLKEIEQELAAVRREAVEECAKIAHRHAAEVNSLLEEDEKINCTTQEGYCIEQEIRALNGPGTKGK